MLHPADGPRSAAPFAHQRALWLLPPFGSGDNAMNTLKTLSSVPLDTSRVELLDHVVILHLVFPQRLWGFSLPATVQTLSSARCPTLAPLASCLDGSRPGGWRWHLMVVLVFISLMSSHVEHLFLPIGRLHISLKRRPLKSFAHF